jgi:CheY-like chemotaxis protein
MSGEAISKILNALVPLAWAALAIYAFWHLRDAIKENLKRLANLKVAGFEVSMTAAAQAVTAAVELAAKHHKWTVNVPEEDKRTALARAARERALLDGAEILWVDDRPGNNRNEWRMFRSLGSHVTAATSTEEATALIDLSREPAGRPFHVAISDMAREGSGDSGSRTLEAFERRAERLPLIFYIGTIDPDRGTPAGAFGLTNRPDQLLNLVLDALARTRIPI